MKRPPRGREGGVGELGDDALVVEIHEGLSREEERRLSSKGPIPLAPFRFLVHAGGELQQYEHRADIEEDGETSSCRH